MQLRDIKTKSRPFYEAREKENLSFSELTQNGRPLVDFVAVEAEQCGIIFDYHIAELPKRIELCDKVFLSKKLFAVPLDKFFVSKNYLPFR